MNKDNHYVLITSFNEEGYKLYAKDMLKSFKKFWNKDVELEAWYHDCELPKDAPKASNITYKNLNDVKILTTLLRNFFISNSFSSFFSRPCRIDILNPLVSKIAFIFSYPSCIFL